MSEILAHMSDQVFILQRVRVEQLVAEETANGHCLGVSWLVRCCQRVSGMPYREHGVVSYLYGAASLSSRMCTDLDNVRSGRKRIMLSSTDFRRKANACSREWPACSILWVRA